MKAQTIDIGIDIGFGNTKGVLNKESHVYIPSQAVKRTGHMINSNAKEIYEYEGEKWLVGQSAIYAAKHNKVEVDSQYIHDDEYAVLALYAIEQLANGSSKKVRVASGMPVGFFEKHRGLLKKRFLAMSSVIAEFKALPQPYGTLIDLMYDWDGEALRTELSNEKIAIIDIGYGTVDAIGINHNEYNHDESKQENEGVSLLHNELQSYISTKYNKTVNQAEIGRVIKDEGIKVRGQFKNMAPQIKQAKEKRVNAIIAIINKVWGGIDNLDRVVFTGGGAKLLEEELNKKIRPEQLIIPEKPGLSNATGFAKAWRVPGWA